MGRYFSKSKKNNENRLDYSALVSGACNHGEILSATI
jgi:hypothetical protein